MCPSILARAIASSLAVCIGAGHAAPAFADDGLSDLSVGTGRVDDSGAAHVSMAGLSVSNREGAETLDAAIWGPAGTPLWVLPGGVGQFLNHEPLKGGIFLGTEVALGAGTVLTWIDLQSKHLATPPGEYDRLVAERTVNNVMFFALLGVVVVGIVDALVVRHRLSEARKRQTR